MDLSEAKVQTVSYLYHKPMKLSTREAYQEEIDNANEIYYTLIGEDASVNGDGKINKRP